MSKVDVAATPAEIEAAKRLCVDLGDEIRAAKQALEDLYTRRRAVFALLDSNGVQRVEIARLSKIEPISVTYVLKPVKPK